MNVLLSHVGEEMQVASILKQWIESSLDRDVRLSGEADVRLDKQRLAEVDRALVDANVALILCSELSVSRPWINFESGCAWLRRVPVIAVCHGGCTPDDLAPPLGSFPAFDLTDAASCQALLETLAKVLKKNRVPRIDYDLMVAEIGGDVAPAEMAAVAAPANGAPVPAAERPRRAPTPAPAPPAQREKPKPLEIRLLATMKHLPDFSCTTTGLAVGLGEAESTVRTMLNKLVNEQLLVQRASTIPSDPDTRYAFTDAGRQYLSKHEA